jgi:hypothetical protein
MNINPPVQGLILSKNKISQTMKTRLLLLLLLPVSVLAQPKLYFDINEVKIPGLPAVQSFAWGIAPDGKWLIVGGRTDGLHKRQPFAAFAPAYNNAQIHVIDVNQKRVWSKPLTGLPAALAEQLQSTNMEFHQSGDWLYLVGGYGYSPTAREFITHPYLTAVNVPGLVDAVVNGKPLTGHFLQLKDDRMAVTGGQFRMLQDDYYLVGGQNFEGRYNPMGPDHGPGFVQQYTDEIRKFKIRNVGGQLSLLDYTAMHDETNLHRRDYNLVPQIMPDGTEGLTAFSGVFQHNADLPFLNSVDITPSGYTVNNDFLQYLNHYHTAHAGFWDELKKEMYTVFFGGISQYYFDGQGNIVSDPDVPFVNHVSVVTRKSDGSMSEAAFDFKMPGLLGASAELIPENDQLKTPNGTTILNRLGEDYFEIIGYMYGGIESTQPNVLFLNGDSLSYASARLFSIGVAQGEYVSVSQVSNSTNPLRVSVQPNPAHDTLRLRYETPLSGKIFFMLQNVEGKIVRRWEAESTGAGAYETAFEVSKLPAGPYLLSASAGKYFRTEKVILARQR